MAAFNYDDYGERPEVGGLLGVALNWAGAVLSVLLIAGLAIWGWQLWQRDVTGIPVVKAMEGPMRVAPEDPGGEAAAYQGLAVNRIAEERAEQMADRVVLAPQPEVLNEDEDLPMADLPPVALDTAEPEVGSAISLADDSEVVEVVPAPSLTVRPLDQAEEPPTETALLAPTEETTDTGDSGESIRILTAPQREMSATDAAVAAALGVLGEEPPVDAVVAAPHVPRVTPRPEMRPVNIQRVSAPAVDPVSGEIDAATIPKGTRLAQLGAYGSLEMARSEWAKVEARFGDYMVGKERVVQQAQTGGRDFYRLRAMGFTDLSDARRFCAVLVADGANCIPVLQE